MELHVPYAHDNNCDLAFKTGKPFMVQKHVTRWGRLLHPIKVGTYDCVDASSE